MRIGWVGGVVFVRVALFPFEHLPTRPTHPSHLFRIQPSTARRRRRSAAMGKLRSSSPRRQRRRNTTRLLKAGLVLVVTAGAQRDTTTDAARRLRTTGAFRPGCGVFDFDSPHKMEGTSGRGGLLMYTAMSGPAEICCIVRLIPAYILRCWDYGRE